MSEILELSGDSVKLGLDSGEVVRAPISSVGFANPKVGDRIKLYKDGERAIIKRADGTSVADGKNRTNDKDYRYINKITYILITFFLGCLGVHRFMRGQVGIGILMILFGWLTFGVWWLVEFIISLAKLSTYRGDDYIFTSEGSWTE